MHTTRVFRPFPILMGMLCCWAATDLDVAQAQNSPPAKAITGYELLAEAAQWAKSSQALEAASQPGATLTQKRRALSDKSVVEALERMHLWLDTPTSPNAAPDPTGESLVPLLTGARALGRALTVQSYVLLADGRVSEAISTLRDGLRLSYAIGNSTMTGWLSGMVIETSLAEQLVAHDDQLAERDCDRLLNLAQEWANASDPLTQVVERMHQERRALVQKFMGAANFDRVLQEIYQDAQNVEGTQLGAQMDRLTPQARQQMLNRASSAIDTAFDQTQLALKTPFWERTPVVAQAGNGKQPEDAVLQLFLSQTMPNFDRIADRYTQIQAITRLLGCHAAIHRYRWEHDSLPPSLEELKLGVMATDPFSGKPFVYKTMGIRYTLESVGPLARDDQGQPIPNKHAPVTLSPGK